MSSQEVISMKKAFRNGLKFILATLSVAFSLQATAATIIRIGTEELVNLSELIFEGVVLSVTAEQNTNNTIYTYVSFSVEDVIVGTVEAGETLTLRFTGGEVNGSRLETGVRIPEIDERGIYFVERVSPGLINPLLGWEQGHFLVTRAGYVITGNRQPVLGVVRQSLLGAQQLSTGVAGGIQTGLIPSSGDTTGSSDDTADSRLSVTEFKQKIRELRK